MHHSRGISPVCRNSTTYIKDSTSSSGCGSMRKPSDQIVRSWQRGILPWPERRETAMNAGVPKKLHLPPSPHLSASPQSTTASFPTPFPSGEQTTFCGLISQCKIDFEWTSERTDSYVQRLINWSLTNDNGVPHNFPAISQACFRFVGPRFWT